MCIKNTKDLLYLTKYLKYDYKNRKQKFLRRVKNDYFEIIIFFTIFRL